MIALLPAAGCSSRALVGGSAGAADLATTPDLTIVPTCPESLQGWCAGTSNCIADLATAEMPSSWPQSCPMYVYKSSCGALVVITQAIIDYDMRYV
jgi:hypothetical protein